jgi:uncharacterized protein
MSFVEIKNCTRCGKIFKSNGMDVCSECEKEDMKEYGKIRDYLYKHQNSSPLEINQATGVDIKLISRFLKEDRFDVKR